MIEAMTAYLTVDGRKAVVIDSKLLNDKRIFVGKIEGIRPFCHWDENGKTFGDKDSSRDLQQ